MKAHPPEHRRAERFLIDQLLRVVDPQSRALVGNVVNLSGDGFMLISPRELPVGKLSALSLELPVSAHGPDRVDFQARCVWCQPARHGGDYGAGFAIEAIEDDARKQLVDVFGGA